MKKITIRLIAVVMVTALLAPIIAGCGGNGPTSNFEAPEFVFVPEFISFPGDISDVSNLTFVNDRLFFSSMIWNEEDWQNSLTKIYSMKTDGSDLQEIYSFNPNANNPFEGQEDITGGMMLASLRVDDDGNIWLVETGQFYRMGDAFDGDFAVPMPMPRTNDIIVSATPVAVPPATGTNDDEQVDPEEDDIEYTNGDGEDLDVEEPGEYDPSIDMPMFPPMYHQEFVATIVNIRKIDTAGRELLSRDVSSIAENSEWGLHINAFNVDSAGNIFIGADMEIFVFDSNGDQLFSIDPNGWVDQLLRMTDGSVAFFGWAESGRVVRTIDVASQGWGDTVELQARNIYQVYPGSGEFAFLYSENDNLFGFNLETGESTKLLNWIESDIMNNGIGNISILPDGRIMCTNNRWNEITGQRFELIFLTKTPYADLPERTVLTLATMYMDWNLRSHILDFNQTSQTHRIHVTDYAEFATDEDWQAGLIRLSTEMISGRIPDLLDVSNLPFNMYVARGLLLDLYPFIDNDPELSREGLVEGVLRAAEIDGKLYRIFSSFSVSTIIGSPLVLGPYPGWNMDEFRAVLNANPRADMPMGQGLTKEYFMQNAIALSMDEFVDWGSGTAHFDRGDFAQLLEFADTFPEEYDWFNMDMSEYMDESQMIALGRQIMSQAWLWDFRSTQHNRMIYGGDIVFKGFPTESRNGSSLSIMGPNLAITTQCSDKDGAWEFIRTILTSDWQRENVPWSFVTNLEVLNEQIADAMTEPEGYGGGGVVISESGGYRQMFQMESYAITQGEIDQIMDLINSITNITSWNNDRALMEIIMDGANDFFSGRNSAQDAARIIQNRASIFISEQS